METLGYQIDSLTIQQKTALINQITVTTTWNDNSITVLDGNDFLDVLYYMYGEYKTKDITKSLLIYSKLNCHAIEELTKNLYDYDLLNHFVNSEYTTNSYSDIAESTTTNTVNTPETTTSTKVASFDSNTPNLQNEITTTTNNNVEYIANSTNTTYDKSDIGHNAKSYTSTTGRNIKLSDILTGEIKVRFKNFIMDYIAIYVKQYCYYANGVISI